MQSLEQLVHEWSVSDCRLFLPFIAQRELTIFNGHLRCHVCEHTSMCRCNKKVLGKYRPVHRRLNHQLYLILQTKCFAKNSTESGLKCTLSTQVKSKKYLNNKESQVNQQRSFTENLCLVKYLYSQHSPELRIRKRKG